MTGGRRTTSSQEVEPLTNYFVGRLKKDFSRGNLIFGGMVTSVYPLHDDPLLKSPAQLPLGGGRIRLERPVEEPELFLGGQHGVHEQLGRSGGDPAAPDSSARYFQRPDRQSGSNGFLSDRYDPDATHLRGLGGYSRLAKDAGKWLFETAVNWRTPGFEANDLAFNTRADYFWMNGNLALSLSRPTRGTGITSWSSATSGNTTSTATGPTPSFTPALFGQLLNYWQVNLFVIRRTDTYDDRATRGGPVVGRPGNMYFNRSSRPPIPASE